MKNFEYMKWTIICALAVLFLAVAIFLGCVIFSSIEDMAAAEKIAAENVLLGEELLSKDDDYQEVIINFPNGWICLVGEAEKERVKILCRGRKRVDGERTVDGDVLFSNNASDPIKIEIEWKR